ncbi:MAG: NADH-quinone oxidoreductase subunit A [Planctomycetota bacterium]|nr:NADH-quinone oxidoreductase subunit A [Planctomycetota bacterium]
MDRIDILNAAALSPTDSLADFPLGLGVTDLSSYLPIALVVVMAITFAIANVVLSFVFGPGRQGKTKGTTYESGMNPVGTARKRFNVRFYLIAMTFLVFDVEIIFLYPWGSTFANLAPGGENAGLWLARIGFFMFTTVVMYLYGLRKGVFKFD